MRREKNGQNPKCNLKSTVSRNKTHFRDTLKTIQLLETKKVKEGTKMGNGDEEEEREKERKKKITSTAPTL